MTARTKPRRLLAWAVPDYSRAERHRNGEHASQFADCRAPCHYGLIDVQSGPAESVWRRKLRTDPGAGILL